MPRAVRTTGVVRWSVNEDVYAWFLRLGNRLQVTSSTLVRMFLLQLKEGDPVTCALVPEFVELGLLDALVRPKVAKIFADPPLTAWLRAFVAQLRHPAYPKRRVHARHLLSGYVRYLQRHEAVCVRYGSLRLDHVLSAAKGSADAPRFDP